MNNSASDYSLQAAINKVEARQTAAAEAIVREQKAIATTDAVRADLAEALAIAEAVAEQVQANIKHKLEGLVTQALAAVFDDPYELRVTLVLKSGRTEAHLAFFKDGEEIDPLNAAGGGVVDVAAFALRLAALTLQGNRVRRALILDEPFRFVSRNYLPAVRDLLHQLTNSLGVQIIMVTHLPELVEQADE